jgi:hypothetical protein
VWTGLRIDAVILSHDILAGGRGSTPPYPPTADRSARANWWHTWTYIGRTAAALNPLGPIYAPEYQGDDKLLGVLPDDQEGA